MLKRVKISHRQCIVSKGLAIEVTWQIEFSSRFLLIHDVTLLLFVALLLVHQSMTWRNF